jgi:hypothetical protein
MSVGLLCALFVGTIFPMRGRPKKPVEEVRENFLRIRLTGDERRALDAAAKSKSLDTSAWARSELLALAKRLAKKP